jgi:hypothetical protein
MSTAVVPFDEAKLAQARPQELAIVPATPPGWETGSSPTSPHSIQAWEAGLSPKVKEYDKRTDPIRWEHPIAEKAEDEFDERKKLLISGITVIMAFIDNVMAYVTFFTIRAFHDRMYNIVDLHIALLTGIDIALIVFAGLGSFTFGMLILLVQCMKLPFFHELMNFRLYLSSIPCGIICAILLYHSERTEWAPFVTLMLTMASIFTWTLHMRVVYQKLSTNEYFNTWAKISLDLSWFIALVCALTLGIFFASDNMQVLTRSEDANCPYAPNERMPVYAVALNQWYCAPWDEESPLMLNRTANMSVSQELTCVDSFMTAFGVSIEPHVVQCPKGCLRTFTGNVVGCGIYSVDSPICIAAIHAGALTDAGGSTVVYGRLGVSNFKRCTRNSVTSTERDVTETNVAVTVNQPTSGQVSSTFVASGGRRLSVTVPTVLAPDGTKVPQAFHFNNAQPGGMPQTEEYIWLKKYDKMPADSGEDGKPWTQIEATVSLRLAGIELEEERIRLGQSSEQSLFVQPRAGQVFNVRPTECRIRESGVVCTGAGAAVVQLDFCRKDVKQCPSSSET